MKKYRTLLFDLDGVILDFKKAEALSFAETFHSYGVEATPALFETYEEINRASWQAYEAGLISNEACTVGRFAKLFEKIGLKRDPKQFALDYQTGLGRGHFLMPHAREVLEELAPDHRLFVVTNGVSSTARNRLLGTDTLRYFQKLFISEEMGAQKPSREYFDQVERGIPDFDRKSTLLIGDTLSSDIKGALLAGLDCCWVNIGHRENETGLCPTYEIDDLRKLPAIAGKNDEKTALRRVGIGLFAAALSSALFLPQSGRVEAMAGSWQYGAFGDGIWSYADTNELSASGWKWLDGNKDGMFECYYFDGEGRLMTDTVIGGNAVNADGQWTVSKSVQRRKLPAWLKAEPVQLIKDTKEEKETLSYPRLALSDPDAARKAEDAVASILKSVQDDARPEGDVMGCAAESSLDYDLVLSKADRYTGLSFQNYTYQEDAAHGLTMEYYLTLTPECGVLRMEDIGGSALEEAVTKAVKAELKKREESGELALFASPDSLKLSFDRQNWMLADDGLHVLFQQYEIAPYAAGLIDVTVPYGSVKDSMNDYGRELLQ